ncbi:hypothetical protein PCASD_12571 [Puccinia coronata f. sp. avenae]|uniref:Uncharacterized protein n=1 Tax=Puccinia coronata f. sp. avenae TaxID=200324 RepID=A0A2N5UM22_9BASI|nr:hypothetical protein PCASD_12571 [Puccinia coronata f. sp. avenae]
MRLESLLSTWLLSIPVRSSVPRSDLITDIGKNAADESSAPMKVAEALTKPTRGGSKSEPFIGQDIHMPDKDIQHQDQPQLTMSPQLKEPSDLVISKELIQKQSAKLDRYHRKIMDKH